MGGLFSSLKPLPKLSIDFDNVTPNEGVEKELYDRINSEVIDPSNELYTRFENYKDGQREATLAVSGDQQSKDDAWNKILPNVQFQMEVYDFFQKATNEFLSLVDVVLDFSVESSESFFTNHPALIKCFAQFFHTYLRFDTQLLMLPKLVNDLAFFRRGAPSRNENGEFDQLLEASNLTTVFWATPMPFLSLVIRSLKTKTSSDPEKLEKIFVMFGYVIDICTSLGRDTTDEALAVLTLRCMTGAILVYDALAPNGAFNKPGFHLKEAIDFLCNHKPAQFVLINFIMYSSTTYDNPTTDQKIKAQLSSVK